MKVRKLAVALALAGGLGSGVAQALGLGEIELQSYLNEPLDADISLRKSEGVSPGDVFVNIAPQSAFDRVGIERNYFLTKLNFRVTTAPSGNLVVEVTTREPLREPYLNFLVEVTWPNGRLMREYAVLVDPPVYAEESGVQEQVAAPASTQRSQPQARQAAPAVTTRNTASIQSRSSAGRTLGPTDSNDTLWTIASQVRPNSNVSMQQVMLAIQDLNPDAFVSGNINRLKRGEVLRIPDENQIRSRSRSQAIQEVAAQNQAFSSPQPTLDATARTADAATGQTGSAGGTDQLRLMAADDGPRDSADGASAGGDGDTAGGVDGGSALVMEELEGARRENQELTGRVDDLQDQVQTLQRLLELKNSQLAEIQNTPDETADNNAMVTGDPATDVAESGEAAGAPGDLAADGATDPGQPEEMASEPAASGTMAEDAMADDGTAEPEAPAEDASVEPAAAVQPESAVSAEPAPKPEPVPVKAAPAEKPFPGNIIDAITNNFLYQAALGGGLVVLLLLLLVLARRNANREKAFYDELNGDSQEGESDAFDLTFDEDDDEAPEGDAIAEADAYIAYGRNDQAAQALEKAISREPSRSDLRLKLLGVYADTQDRESFDKQFWEIEALDDDAATAEAESLRSRLEEAESMPSIDDLESQLRSGGSEGDDKSSFDSSYDIEAYQPPESDESDDLALDVPEDAADSDLEELDLELPEEEADDLEAETDAEDDGAIEFDLTELESDDDATSDLTDSEPSDKPEDSEKLDDLDEPFDFSLEEDDLPQSDRADEVSKEPEDEDDLSLDFDTSDFDMEDDEATPEAKETGAEPASAPSQDQDQDEDAAGELDESFLDDLDAELDKVAGEEDVEGLDDESEFDDLELDVSDEDLALMEEFSEADEEGPAGAPESAEDDGLSPGEELGPEDAEETETMVPPVAAQKDSGRDSERDMNETDLGDDDDFDFLSGTDEASTKLDLARAYVEMGDVDGARDILEEVALEGNDEQKAEAQDLLKNLS